uniref:Uncharacterized protein n=1 Tax=Mycena chlorophos TaxID=658473 RepID=A0ABQ0LXI7_MYCCL|nr:predicted protein [Mycena chlorophos]
MTAPQLTHHRSPENISHQDIYHTARPWRLEADADSEPDNPSANEPPIVPETRARLANVAGATVSKSPEQAQFLPGCSVGGPSVNGAVQELRSFNFFAGRTPDSERKRWMYSLRCLHSDGGLEPQANTSPSVQRLAGLMQGIHSSFATGEAVNSTLPRQ